MSDALNRIEKPASEDNITDQDRVDSVLNSFIETESNWLTSDFAIETVLTELFPPDIAFLDFDVLSHNINLGKSDGMSEYDRSIDLKTFDYILDNYGWLFVSLINQSAIRTLCVNAVVAEIKIDEYGLDTENAREDNYDDIMTVDLSNYNETVLKQICSRIVKSLDEIENYVDFIDMLVLSLTEDDKISIGFCISNFMYLFRAFAQNKMFVKYIKEYEECIRNHIKEYMEYDQMTLIDDINPFTGEPVVQG
ncbi:MAG: hypothetical protein K6E98_12025 [Lachnospiraceae bacterium]|nr:hypothetical protein [Lachnospiraceae bacterium]